jgi:hypothetical protein
VTGRPVQNLRLTEPQWSRAIAQHLMEGGEDVEDDAAVGPKEEQRHLIESLFAVAEKYRSPAGTSLFAPSVQWTVTSSHAGPEAIGADAA